jgi:hypothetical protein
MFTRISLVDSELMAGVRVILASVSSSEENRLSERGDNAGAAEGKRESGVLGVF